MTNENCPYCGAKMSPESTHAFKEPLRESQKPKRFCNKRHYSKWIARQEILRLQEAGKIDQVTATNIIEELG